MNFLEDLKNRFILFDGAMGTMLQKAGLKGGESPEEWNLSKPEIIKDIYREYIRAGSDVVTTNTFGGNRIKLKEFGLEDKVREINQAAVRNAKEAAGKDVYVAGSLGPTGKFIEPVGDLSFEEAVDIFSEQIAALRDGGADMIILETMIDIKEVKAALLSAKQLTDLPVISSMTFEDNMRSLLGTPPEVFAIVSEAMGADVVGANCSLGIEGMLKIIELMSGATRLPLIAQANAGMPCLKDGVTFFPATPEEMANHVPELTSHGVRIVGGCCGTIPVHIKKIGETLSGVEEKKRSIKVSGTTLAGRTGYISLGWGNPPAIVGERINPTGKKALTTEIVEGKTSIIRKEAKGQMENGADILDINVGVPGGEEPASMKRAVFAVNENCVLPIVLDSSDTIALEEGLKACDGKALVNSVTGEEKKLASILPIVKKYGASVIGLTIDEWGIPATAEGRFKVVRRIMRRALHYGISKRDIVIDCLALSVSAGEGGAKETLKAIRMVKEKLGLTTILGVSNISFGLPERGIINASFMSMAIEAGLDLAIINPHNSMIMDAYHASILLKGYDLRAERYIKRHNQRSGVSAKKPAEGTVIKPEGIKEQIFNAVVEGDKDNVLNLIEDAFKQGWVPIKVSNEALLPALEEVGRLFEENIYFLPQMMLSAETMKRAFKRIKKELKGWSGESLGKIIMATVEGDIHDIGKNIVSTLLDNHGFDVIDLGKNISAQKILKEAIKNRVDAVGLSALMTTTVAEMDKVIKLLKKEGIKTFTIIGGAVVTQEFADQIGADIYAKDAMDAVRKIKGLIAKKR
ncbi:MAG: homocysteine S-methyltransferase family protein [Thermodesulfobacteriota bacterium]